MMTLTRSQLGFLFVAVLALTILLLLTSGTAPTVSAQTVPTITPSPPPGQDPTDEPPPATSAAVSPTSPPVATNTRVPTTRATATATGQPTRTASPTPLLSGAAAAWPTVEPCSQEPTVQVGSRGAWVYEGPGEDYEPVGRLAARTVRPILARAAEASWWEIELNDGQNVWIADDDVSVQGDTSEVMVKDAPPLPDGATPTPGPTWEPTPNARCAEPTATATATATATRVPDTPTPSPSPAPSSTPVADDATATPDLEAEAAAPSPEDGSDSSLFWLPVAGIVLLAAGVFLYVTRRT